MDATDSRLEIPRRLEPLARFALLLVILLHRRMRSNLPSQLIEPEQQKQRNKYVLIILQADVFAKCRDRVLLCTTHLHGHWTGPF